MKANKPKKIKTRKETRKETAIVNNHFAFAFRS